MDATETSAAQGCAGCAALREQVRQLQVMVGQLQQQVRELQARLDQDSSNSHQPPSSDPPWTSKPSARKPTGNKPGGQVGHQGHHRHRLPMTRVNRVIDHVPRVCRHCRGPLSKTAALNDPPPSWHQVAELPAMAAIVTEHRGHARRCRQCGRITRQPIPASVRAHVLGPRLSATMSYLTGRCHDGRRTVREIVRDLFDVPISLGTVSNYERQMSQALAVPHTQALRRVRRADVVKHVDETGWKRAGKSCWLWTCATVRAAAFAIHPLRDWRGLCDLLGNRRGGRGTICSDRWHAYSRLGIRRRQLCWAHLKRDFQKWFDQGGATRLLGKDGLTLSKRVFKLWRNFRRRRLTRRQLQRRLGPVRRRMRQVLTWGLRCADAKAARFCRKLLKIEAAMWTFARVAGLEPTNNLAERMLRPAVLWRKNSFGCQSDAGCRFAERMLTAVQTLRVQNHSILTWLEQALTARRNGLHCPKLC
jgi:transposase